MIDRLENKEVYNPIRDHINIGFQEVKTTEEMIFFICSDLKDRKFNQSKSRGLVFVPTRKKVEDVAELLKAKLADENLPFAQKVDFYHAGLEGVEREEKYDQFKSGETVILVATKAFGMGMDIKNIHYVYHVSPSSTFEDYLQEVGRAGRHKGMLHAAGFSSESPIQTTCLFLPDDFKKMKDKLHDSQITWNQLEQVKAAIFEYVEQFNRLKIDDEKGFALPLDLLEQLSGFEDIFNTDTFFRLALYWLEKLSRIKLGVYTPTQLPIRLLPKENWKRPVFSEDGDLIIDDLTDGLKRYRKKYFPGSDLVMIEINKLKEFVTIKSPLDILILISRAQKQKRLIVERTIKLVPTKTRSEELKSWGNYTTALILEAVFELAYELLSHTTTGDQKSFDGKFVDHLSEEIAARYFVPEKIYWIEEKEGRNLREQTPEGIAEKLKDDFLRKRVKFAFKLIGFLPQMRHKSIIDASVDTDHPEIVQLVYNGYKSHKEWKQEIEGFKNHLIKLIQEVSEAYFGKNIERFNIVDLLVRLGIEEREQEHFQQLVFMAKALAYLKGDGSLIPMGIELFIKNTSPFAEKDQTSIDHQVFVEFNEAKQMRGLRLLALECLSFIPVNEFDQYIKDYFRSASISDIIRLLEDKLGEEHDNLKAFRAEALEKAKSELNEEQRVVYDTDISRNLQVIAGPGSGKTHTLTLRVARLIEEEKIRPDSILVLAYNRAVVVELKERLGQLFRELGYGKLINRLKVFTFHGFCKFCLNERLNEKDFDNWTKIFIRVATAEPGIIAQRLGNIRYVFVDEFQDITNERMQLLKHIAPPDKVKVCVIGDPNQSIYGYERARVGDPMDPKPYYEHFSELYNPVELNLVNNYRSYPEIIEVAEKLLERNKSRFQMPQLVAQRKPKINTEYCHVIDGAKEKWQKHLEVVLFEKGNDNMPKYNQIAVMFRTNNEVLRAFNLLMGKSLSGCRIRIQGTNTSISRTREFHHILKTIELRTEEAFPLNFSKEFENTKNEILLQYHAWDKYLIDLFHCLIIEFEKVMDESTIFGDFIAFVQEVANKDDGQIGKIYQNNIRRINPEHNEQEIVLTTIHKVKGMEYDAVIIPPSFADLPVGECSNNELLDYIEEERRLYYVAYTRAKFRLLVFTFERENNMSLNSRYKLDEQKEARLGIPFKEGIDKLNFSWGANAYNFSQLKNAALNLKVGDLVVLRKKEKKGFIFWELDCNGAIVGQLNKNHQPKSDGLSEIKELRISSIDTYTHFESKLYDEKHNTDYTRKWCAEACNDGFVYLVDFAGYGKAINEN